MWHVFINIAHLLGIIVSHNRRGSTRDHFAHEACILDSASFGIMYRESCVREMYCSNPSAYLDACYRQPSRVIQWEPKRYLGPKVLADAEVAGGGAGHWPPRVVPIHLLVSLVHLFHDCDRDGSCVHRDERVRHEPTNRKWLMPASM